MLRCLRLLPGYFDRQDRCCEGLVESQSLCGSVIGAVHLLPAVERIRGKTCLFRKLPTFGEHSEKNLINLATLLTPANLPDAPALFLGTLWWSCFVAQTVNGTPHEEIAVQQFSDLALQQRVFSLVGGGSLLKAADHLSMFWSRLPGHLAEELCLERVVDLLKWGKDLIGKLLIGKPRTLILNIPRAGALEPRTHFPDRFLQLTSSMEPFREICACQRLVQECLVIWLKIVPVLWINVHRSIHPSFFCPLVVRDTLFPAYPQLRVSYG